MIKEIKNNKILSVVLLTVLIIVCNQTVFYFIPIYEIRHYISVRYDYPEYKKLSGCGKSIDGKDGYIARISYYDLEKIEEDIATINSLQRLHFLEVHTCGSEDKEMVCSQMKLLAEIDNQNLTEMQYDCLGEPWFDCLHLPRSVTTLRIRGTKIDDDDLMKLSKFDHVKEILVYSGFGKLGEMRITAEGVKAFNEIRPDVKVWWDEDINMERRSRDFWLPGHDAHYYK